MIFAASCAPLREACDRFLDRCSRLFPCLAEPVRRSSLGLKLTLVLLHMIVVGSLFLLDSNLIQETRLQPWHTGAFLLLFVATLFQYFYTSSTSPGYVVDAMRAEHGQHATVINFSTVTMQSASRNGNLTSCSSRDLLGRNDRVNSSSWLKLVMELYPPGSSSRSWTCTYCNIIQPPRSKHCHDCDRCVLQFDHHCVWLGTCIGKGNHCCFWWYIFGETLLSIWTSILYITFLRSSTTKQWWTIFLGVILLAVVVVCLVFLLLMLFFHSYLALTNQTTYELVRRRRILYLRGVPERVRPFSKGICRNIYTFCCSRDALYSMEAVPTLEELEAKARPYTCLDVISCRCC